MTLESHPEPALKTEHKFNFFDLFKKKPAKQVPFWSVENFRSLAILIVSVLALRWSIASPYEVPTASMEPTIKVGDRILSTGTLPNVLTEIPIHWRLWPALKL